MTMRLLSVLAVMGLNGSVASAKPPEAPTIPETEFRVLPPLSQDFFQTNATAVPSTFVPIVDAASPAELFGSVGGAGLDMAWRQRTTHQWAVVLVSESRPYANQAGGFHSYGSSWLTKEEAVANRLTVDFQKWGMAREVFAMAEAFRSDRNWIEAERWYAGVSRLWPRSPYAVLAARQREYIVLQRLLNEAGEEQSEEPPLAGPEKLTVMPREVK